MGYDISTADTNREVTWLPGDIFVKGAPDRVKDKMPYVAEGKEGPQWEIEGEFMCGVGGGGLGRALGPWEAGPSGSACVRS